MKIFNSQHIYNLDKYASSFQRMRIPAKILLSCCIFFLYKCLDKGVVVNNAGGLGLDPLESSRNLTARLKNQHENRLVRSHLLYFNENEPKTN